MKETERKSRRSMIKGASAEDERTRANRVCSPREVTIPPVQYPELLS